MADATHDPDDDVWDSANDDAEPAGSDGGVSSSAREQVEATAVGDGEAAATDARDAHVRSVTQFGVLNITASEES